MKPLPGKEQKTSIRSLLSRMGLNHREIDVYLALLPRKIARATVLAKAAKQSRSHTYLVLRSLEEKGLVSEIERGKVLHFVAESPQKLMHFVENREEELLAMKPLLTHIIPQLQALTAPLIGQPRITMLHGIEGMKQVYREILPRTFCGIFNPESMYRSFGANIIHMVLGKGVQLRGRDLLVDNAMSHRYLSEVEQTDEYEIRLLPKGITFPTDTNFSGDTVAIFAYDEEQTIIMLENENIVESFRTWFEMLWNLSTKTQ